jgi:cell division protein FtsI/penicillin-binding protein 2
MRNFDQASGIISSGIVRGAVRSFADVPPLRERERRMFGIGQGNFRATPLQVANAMAALARRGIFKRPKLIKEVSNFKFQTSNSSGIDLGISPDTLDVIYDGMSAVVNEYGGTANRQFEPFLTIFAREDVKVYGKTGSTERPEHAWFGGFAADSTGRKIAFAVVVEGGQHGSSDAAPLAREIIQLAVNEGHIGNPIFAPSP